MSLSAVSLAWSWLAVSYPQIGRLSVREQALWRRMEPSIAILTTHGSEVGAAALIEDSGLFVANSLVVSGTRLTARRMSGEALTMTVLRRDGASGLVLLQAEPWQPGTARPFRAPVEEEQPGGQLLAVLGTGPLRAEFVSANHYGVLHTSRRLVPLCEIRFEAPAETVGSALVFCENGEIIGALNATLRRSDQAWGGPQVVAGFENQVRPPALGLQQNQIGPSQLTVAYTVGPEVVRRVIEGFCSPTHEVTFPSLGVMCLNNIGGGALVQSVTPGSSAEKVGIRVGDVIQNIGGAMIRDQVDFAKVMFRQKIGAKVTVQVNRGNGIMLLDASIGAHIQKSDK